MYAIRSYYEHDDGRVGEHARHLAEATQVLAPLLGREPEVAAEPVPHVLRVEDVGVDAALGQRRLDPARDRRNNFV